MDLQEIWRDKATEKGIKERQHEKKILLMLLIIFSILFIVTFLYSFYEYGKFGDGIFFAIMLLIILYVFYRRPVYKGSAVIVYREGVKVMDHYIPKHNIKDIKIIHSPSHYNTYNGELVAITDTSKKKYETYVVDISGFKEALQKSSVADRLIETHVFKKAVILAILLLIVMMGLYILQVYILRVGSILTYLTYILIAIIFIKYANNF